MKKTWKYGDLALVSNVNHEFYKGVVGEIGYMISKSKQNGGLEIFILKTQNTPNTTFTASCFICPITFEKKS